MSSNQRIAVVTGGGRGIGASISRRLADDGNAVAVVDIDADTAVEMAEELARNGHRAIGVAADVSSEDSVDRAVAQIEDELGPPTILINNAGILRDNLLFKMSQVDWDDVAGVHLRGSFLMSKRIHGYMRESGFGKIINLSSTSALGNRGQANYATAKAGIQGFTKTLAIELGRFGVTVNAVAPGFIVTDMTRATAERVGQDFNEFTAARVANIPVGRGGTPDDIAHVVSFFADDRSGFVTGQIVYAAGGPRG